MPLEQFYRFTIIITIAVGITSLGAGFGIGWYIFRDGGLAGVVDDSEKLTERINYLEGELSRARDTITESVENARVSRETIDGLIRDNKILEDRAIQAENQNIELGEKLTESRNLIESITNGTSEDAGIIDGAIETVRTINEILGKYDPEK